MIFDLDIDIIIIDTYLIDLRQTKLAYLVIFLTNEVYFLFYLLMNYDKDVVK